MSTRTEKIDSVIERELGKILLQEFRDELTGLVTITDVKTTGDLSEARVNISVVGQDEDEVLAMFKRDIYQIQGELNKHLVLRKFPRIIFQIDERGDVADKINKLIDESGT